MIGGAEIYAAALPFADELLLTEIDAEFDGDTVFPPDRRRPSSRRSSASRTCRRDGPPFAFVRYVRRARAVSRPLVGTSGWGYPSWQPGFYPAGLDRSEFLVLLCGAAPDRRAECDEVPAAVRGAVPRRGRRRFRTASGSRSRRPTASSAGSPRSRSGCAASATGSAASASSSSGRATTASSSCCSARPTRGIRYALDLRDPSWDGVEERLAEAGAVRVGRRPRRRPAGRTCATASCATTDEELDDDRGRARRARRTRDRDVRVLPPRRRAGCARGGAAGRGRQRSSTTGSRPPLHAVTGFAGGGSQAGARRVGGYSPRHAAVPRRDRDHHRRHGRLVPLLRSPRRPGRARRPTGDDHFEATLPSGVRLMWDSVELMKQIDPAGSRLPATARPRLPLRLAGRCRRDPRRDRRGRVRLEGRAVAMRSGASATQASSTPTATTSTCSRRREASASRASHCDRTRPDDAGVPRGRVGRPPRRG